MRKFRTDMVMCACVLMCFGASAALATSDSGGTGGWTASCKSADCDGATNCQTCQ